MKKNWSTSGQALASLLVFGAISAIMMASTAKMLLNNGKSARGITSNIDLNEISNTFHLLTQNPANCLNSGLASVDATTLLSPSPTPLPVELSLGSNGQAMLAAGKIFGGTRLIKNVSLTSLMANGNPNSYLGTIVVTTNIIGSALTMRNPQLSFNLNVTLDATGKIISCYGGGGGPTEPEPEPDPSVTPPPPTRWELLNMTVLPANKFFPSTTKWYGLDIVNGFKMIRIDTNSDGFYETTCLDRNNDNIFDWKDAPNICQGDDGLPSSQLPAQNFCTYLGMGDWHACPHDDTNSTTYLALGNILLINARIDLSTIGVSHSTIGQVIMRDITASGPEIQLTIGQHGDSAGNISAQTTFNEIKLKVIPNHTYQIWLRMYAAQYRISNAATFSRLSSPVINIYDYSTP